MLLPICRVICRITCITPKTTGCYYYRHYDRYAVCPAGDGLAEDRFGRRPFVLLGSVALFVLASRRLF